MIAPLVGGYLIDTLGYRADFLISGTGRLIAVALFFFAVSTPKQKALGAWGTRRRAAPA